MESKALSNKEILDKFLSKKRLKKAFYISLLGVGLNHKNLVVENDVFHCFRWALTPEGLKWEAVASDWNKLWNKLELYKNKGVK